LITQQSAHMVENIKLSKNFWLYEMLESQTARRYEFEEQYEPTEKIIDNLKALCENILQPLRDDLKTSISVSSGYRCQRLNTAIGGASKSQHLTAHAADIQCFQIGNEELLKRIAKLKLPFDQMINEFNYAWVHISYDPSKNRRQILEAYKNSNRQTKYREITL